MGERVAIVWYDGDTVLARDYDHWGDGYVIPRIKAATEYWKKSATKSTLSLRTLYYTLIGIMDLAYGSAEGLGWYTQYFEEYNDDPKKLQGDLQRVYHVKVDAGEVYIKVENRDYEMEKETNWEEEWWWSSSWHELGYWLQFKEYVWSDWHSYIELLEALGGIYKNPEEKCKDIKELRERWEKKEGVLP